MKNAIGGLYNKIKKNKNEEPETQTLPEKTPEEKRTEKSEVYESKFVKEIIANYNNVLRLIE